MGLGLRVPEERPTKTSVRSEGTFEDSSVLEEEYIICGRSPLFVTCNETSEAHLDPAGVIFGKRKVALKNTLNLGYCPLQ